jgi:hypothetical protein
MLAGGGLFNNLDYSFSVGHEDGMDREPNGPGGGSATLRAQLHFLSNTLNSLPLLELKPDPAIVQHAAGATAHALAGQNSILIYFDGSLQRVDLALSAGTYKAHWLDTTGRQVATEQTFEEQGRTTRELVPPAVKDGWALKLQRKPAR